MTIQLPVVLWTVICFLLMTVILKNLLFKPVLELLDSRKAKSAAAREKQALIEQMEHEHSEKLSEIERENQKRREQRIKTELEEIRAQNKNDIENAKAARLASAEEYKAKTDTEKQAVISSFNEKSDEIVRAFAERLISR